MKSTLIRFFQVFLLFQIIGTGLLSAQSFWVSSSGNEQIQSSYSNTGISENPDAARLFTNLPDSSGNRLLFEVLEEYFSSSEDDNSEPEKAGKGHSAFFNFTIGNAISLQPNTACFQNPFSLVNANRKHLLLQVFRI